jgi:peptidoglycan/xylan/chitin deacetylase (PgdA/CDA1 family)
VTQPRPTNVPFAERGGALRGALDLITGCYPSFLFGAGLGSLLPVFHLHQTTRAQLEPRLRYLAENGYRTVTADAISRLVRQRVSPGPRTVAQCFDDAWASLWTVAAPLLKEFGFQAITFAIPGRITDAPGLRPVSDSVEAVDYDRSERPFVTWPELRALAQSGTIDVQSHSWSHSMIFAGGTPLTFVTPAFADEPLLNRPRVAAGPVTPVAASGDDEPLRFLAPDCLGAPLYPRRSRLSDAWRYRDDAAARHRCVTHVREHGGAAFFDREGWEDALRVLHGTTADSFEGDSERQAAMTMELDRARTELESRLGTRVRHACAPWGVAGALTRDVATRLGLESLFADRLWGRRAVAAGDDPYSLMRLHERFIMCLPGRGRKFFFTAA